MELDPIQVVMVPPDLVQSLAAETWLGASQVVMVHRG